MMCSEITGHNCGWKLKGAMIDADVSTGCNSGNDSDTSCYEQKLVTVSSKVSTEKD